MPDRPPPDARDLRQLASQLTLARERERKIIATELHDNIGQNLAFIRMKLKSLRGDAIFSGFDKNLDSLLNLLDQTIASTRSLTFELSPPVLYELGLVPALEWLAERYEHSHGLPIDIHADPNLPQLPEDTRGMLFSAIRELIINVIKHAGASRAEIEVLLGDRALQITVTDDGCGMPANLTLAPDVHPAGFGLFSIRERFLLVGGEFEIRPARKGGTSVHLLLPQAAWDH